MRSLAPILISLGAALAGCNTQPDAPGVEIENARITLPAVKGRPGAAYFKAEADTADRLTAISSPRVGRIELHESMAGGMGPLKDSSIPPDGELAFEPGGKHAMLFELDPTLKVGDSIPLTFSFERAPPVTVQAELLGPGAASSHAGH
jgi:copper(I)-binding protein